MIINFSGPDSNFFANGLNANNDLQILSSTSTSIILRNPDNGAITTVTGTGIVIGPNDGLLAGTFTGLSFQQGTTTVATVTGISWAAVDINAAFDGWESGSNAGWNALLSQQDITLNVLGGTGFNGNDVTGFEANNVTSRFNIVGSDHNDVLAGGAGNDTINVGNNPGYDTLRASTGNDTIILSDINGTLGAGYVDFLYFGLNAFNQSIVATFDGAANTATITKGAHGTDTFIDIQNPLETGWSNGGVGLYGTNSNDTFNISTHAQTWMQIGGEGGADTYNLTINGGTIRLDFRSGNPTHGVNIDLGGAGIIDDGFGNAETLNVTRIGSGSLEIRGTDFADTIVGGADNDRFITRQGNDSVDGGAGYDVLRYDRSNVGAVNVDLNAGTVTGTWYGNAFTDTVSNVEEYRGSRNDNDTMTGDANDNVFRGRGGNDTLIGNEGEDRLYGGDGNDHLFGGDGRDRLYGGSGNDTINTSGGTAASNQYGDIVYGGTGSNTFIGSQQHFQNDAGMDILWDNIAGTGGLVVTVGANGTGTAVSNNAGVVNDTFTFADYFAGTSENDVFHGSSNTFYEGWAGGAGDDTIYGGGGTDELAYLWDGGTNGIDINLATGTATDSYGDTDTFTGITRVRATNQNDVVRGAATNDTLRGEGGNDSVYGGAGADLLSGGDGNDRLYGGSGSDRIYGGGGNDYIRVGGGAESFYGGSGHDYISYYSSSNGVTINLETSTVSGSWAVNDVIDSFESATGSRTGDDRITGTSGANTIRTYGGDDRVYAGGGSDRVYLGSGDDYVRVGGGAESFYGGSGNDYISYYSSSNGVTVNLATNTVSRSWAVNDVIDSFESVSGSRTGDDRITGTSGENTIRTYGGDDRVYAGGGSDEVYLGSGDDYVRVGGGAESFYGGSGHDYISYYSSSNGIRIDLAADTVSGSWAVNDTIDSFESASGSRTGNDVMLGTSGSNTFRSYGGNDRLYGRSGDDALYGGSGNDRFDGGAGTDSLFGGTGADTFHFDRGEDHDIIKDFEDNVDRIELDNFTFAPGEDAFDFADQVGADVVFTFGNGDILTVENATILQLMNDVVMV